MVAEKNKTLFITVSFKEGAKDKQSKNTNHHGAAGIKKCPVNSGHLKRDIDLLIGSCKQYTLR